MSVHLTRRLVLRPHKAKSKKGTRQFKSEITPAPLILPQKSNRPFATVTKIPALNNGVHLIPGSIRGNPQKNGPEGQT